jgi:hypothetical protein
MAADAASPDPTAFAIAGSNRTRARNKVKENGGGRRCGVGRVS